MILSAAIAAGILISLYVLSIFKQNTYWRGETPLFSRTAQYEPDFGRGHVLLGRAYAKEGDCSKAVVSFRKALTIFENYRASTQSPLLKGLYVGLIQDVKKTC
ncbi:MAG: hypothetical protein JW847_04235 [Candidatus Omnitrophica bacterium]|nr:hypothetical protein [Candidatus Omnitrophota bacterium]